VEIQGRWLDKGVKGYKPLLSRLRVMTLLIMGALYLVTTLSLLVNPATRTMEKKVTLPETDPAATGTWMGLSINARGDFSGIYMTMARIGTATYPRLLSMDLATGKVWPS